MKRTEWRPVTCIKIVLRAYVRLEFIAFDMVLSKNIL